MNRKLKTRPKTEDELLNEMNKAKQDWRDGKYYTLEESLERIDLAIKRTREMEKKDHKNIE